MTVYLKKIWSKILIKEWKNYNVYLKVSLKPQKFSLETTGLRWEIKWNCCTYINVKPPKALSRINICFLYFVVKGHFVVRVAFDKEGMFKMKERNFLLENQKPSSFTPHKKNLYSETAVHKSSGHFSSGPSGANLAQQQPLWTSWCQRPTAIVDLTWNRSGFRRLPSHRHKVLTFEFKSIQNNMLVSQTNDLINVFLKS